MPKRIDTPAHLWQRPGSKKWQARVRVPPGAGLRQTHIVRSLKTTNRSEALRRLPGVVGDIKAEIEAARRTPQGFLKATDPAKQDVEAALWWRERFARDSNDPHDPESDRLFHQWREELDARLGDPVGLRSGLDGGPEPVYDPARERRVAAFVGMVREGKLPVGSELDRYLAETKPKSSYRSRIELAVRRLGKWLQERPQGDHVLAVTKAEAATYVDHLASGEVTMATVNSHVSALNSYWEWMSKRGAIAGDNPWRNQQRSLKADERASEKRPFTDEEVTALLRGETYSTLHDVMRLCLLTGLRQSEAGRLRVRDIGDDWLRVTDSKTKAGVRRVPVHPSLKTLIDRRVVGKDPADFLIEELVENPKRPERRAQKIGERFTAYRRTLELDERLDGRRQANADFHSFRRWFIKQLDHADVAPQIIASIVGHEEGRDFLALVRYSPVASDQQMVDAVRLVALPKGAPVESPSGPPMGSGRRVRVKASGVTTARN